MRVMVRWVFAQELVPDETERIERVIDRLVDLEKARGPGAVEN